MCALQHQNGSGFETFIYPTLNREGREMAVAIVKGTFLVTPDGRLELAPEQVPVAVEDTYAGEPGKSSVAYESDLALFKPGTDVVVNGEAVVPRGRRARRLDVSIAVGRVTKRIRVVGDRVWERVLGVGPLKRSRPEPFSRMPLQYERAFGGTDPRGDEENPRDTDYRNPVGRGYQRGLLRAAGVALPNLENPRRPVRRPRQRPAPWGCGFVGRGWEQRRRYTGTMDERWQRERMPILPSDFDYRFFQAASEDLIARPHLRGGERVRVSNCSEWGDLDFQLPTDKVGLTARWTRGRVEKMLAALDTVVLEPTIGRVMLVWRRALVCERKASELLSVTSFSVSERGAREMLGDRIDQPEREPA